jgi:hypothetical protein
VRSVAGTGAVFATLSEWNARHPGLSALRWDGADGSVSLAAVAEARAGAAEAGRRLASAALLQLGDAARDAEALAAALGGTRAISAPPGGPPRAGTDPLCEAWRRFAETPADAAPLREALEQAAAMTPPPWLRVRVDADGLHAELACPDPGGAAANAPGEGAATLHLVATQAHPSLGPGLLAVLRPPMAIEPVAERRVATAALLNEGEAREATGFDAFGAWCVHPTAGLAHVAFHPALLFEASLPAHLAWEAGLRGRWARVFLALVARLRPGA